MSAKKGRISDLVCDDIEEESLRIICVQGGQSVEYALKCSSDGDHDQEVINAVLNDQALDLDEPDELDVPLVSIDEASSILPIFSDELLPVSVVFDDELRKYELCLRASEILGLY